MKLTIDTNSMNDIVVRNENGKVVAKRKTYCNPAAIHQAILDAGKYGEIDWENSMVAKPASIES